MDPYQETHQTWNQLARPYLNNFSGLSLYDPSYVFFLHLLSERKVCPKILDVGCGPGIISKFLIRHNPGLEILGIDVSENMIELARKNVFEVGFMVLNLLKIRSLEKGFGGIAAGFCIPYLTPDDVNLFFREVYYLCEPRGIFYFSFVEGKAEKSGYQVGSTGLRTYFHFYETDFLKAISVESGFVLEKEMEFSYSNHGRAPETHKVLVVSKPG
jgi:SAM-dependent methyltransferase